MSATVLSALEERFLYYRRRFRHRPQRKAVEYARNWAYGVYRWAFGEEPPDEWKDKVEKKLRELKRRSMKIGAKESRINEYVQ